MDIATGDPLEQATPHLKALSWLWGIGPMDVIATQNMDYVSLDEIEEKVQNAIKEGLKLVEEWQKTAINISYNNDSDIS